MTDTDSDLIHTFWVGPYTKYGCFDCERAAWDADDITHTDDCAISTAATGRGERYA